MNVKENEVNELDGKSQKSEVEMTLILSSNHVCICI